MEGMESNSKYQILKLKVASEIVRSSQAAVAFSRAFYLEEVLIDKIGKELKDLYITFKEREEVVGNLLKTVDIEDNIVAQCNIRVICTSIQNELDSKSDLFEEFQKRILQAGARRQSKSSQLQKLSTNELMSKFESLTVTEMKELQVPEFSCFINDSDFGLLERLNDDWNKYRKEVMSLIDISSSQLDLLKVQDHSSSYRKIHGCPYPGQVESEEPKCSAGVELEATHLEEIGKTFANRSGSVMRKFSTLLRRGKKPNKTLSSGSYEDSSKS